MNKKLAQLLEKLTPEEQLELETFAAFLVARRRPEGTPPATKEKSDGQRLHSVLELKDSQVFYFGALLSPFDDAHRIRQYV